MKILLVTQYFWPENFIINDLVKELSLNGHEIKILTGKPNYPEGKVFKGYTQKGCRYDSFIKHNDIFRVPLKPRSQGRAGLIRNYLSFIFNGLNFFPRGFQYDKFDIIFTVGFSPVTSAIPAIFLKKKLNIPLVLWVQDLWPESVKATGYIKNKWVLKFIGKLVKYIYKQSDLILMQSQAFKPLILKIIGNDNKNKLIYYPNSFADFTTCKTQRAPQSVINLLQEKFCVVFAGNIGAAQNTDIWVQAAKFLQPYSEIRIVIVGQGSKYQELLNNIAKFELENIICIGGIALNKMWEIYQYASLLLVTLRQNSALSATVPSKIQAYMAAGRPIVGAIDGEASRIIKESVAGFTVDSDDGKGLAELILKVYKMSVSEREMLGKNAKNYYLENFEMKKQAQNLISIFNNYLISS